MKDKYEIKIQKVNYRDDENSKHAFIKLLIHHLLDQGYSRKEIKVEED